MKPTTRKLTHSALMLALALLLSMIKFYHFPNGEYLESWKYTPFLLLATSFSCFVTFLGSIYMTEKKSVATLVTTALGAGANVILNALLIPRFGINGGTFATFASYLIVFACLLYTSPSPRDA